MDQRNPRVGCLERLRPPDLGFGLPLVEDLVVDCGLKQATEACCRYSHHPSCQNAVTSSVMAITYRCHAVETPDDVSVCQLEPFKAPGDLLSNLGLLFGAVRTQHATIEATVMAASQALGDVIVVESIAVAVWCLTAAEVDAIEAQWAALPPPEAQLTLTRLDPDDEETYRAVTEAADYVPLDRYPPTATVLPNEIGRDRYHRYFSEGIVKAPDPVDRTVIKEASVHVVLANGAEADVAVKATYSGAAEEPVSLEYATYNPVPPGGRR